MLASCLIYSETLSSWALGLDCISCRKCNECRSPLMQDTSAHMVASSCLKSLPNQTRPPPYFTPNPLWLFTTHMPLRNIWEKRGGRGKPLQKKGLLLKSVSVERAMFSLLQQIYTVVSDGLGFLPKHGPPIINSTAADTARHLHSSLTLQDCSRGLWGGAEVGRRVGGAERQVGGVCALVWGMAKVQSLLYPSACSATEKITKSIG